ncbi:hypothetical protein EDD85DRAFT_549973 [Armillaria nabsnona]|nr:hypothetical protein EDD85DRAFT_549973 [Armillaria nabsnona]
MSGRRYGLVHAFLAGTLSSDIFWGAYRLWVWTPPFQYEMPKLGICAPARSRSHDYRGKVKLARRRRRGLGTLLWLLIYNRSCFWGDIRARGSTYVFVLHNHPVHYFSARTCLQRLYLSRKEPKS